MFLERKILATHNTSATVYWEGIGIKTTTIFRLFPGNGTLFAPQGHHLAPNTQKNRVSGGWIWLEIHIKIKMGRLYRLNVGETHLKNNWLGAIWVTQTKHNLVGTRFSDVVVFWGWTPGGDYKSQIWTPRQTSHSYLGDLKVREV